MEDVQHELHELDDDIDKLEFDLKEENEDDDSTSKNYYNNNVNDCCSHKYLDERIEDF